MFTGIIQVVGSVVAAEPRGGDLQLRIEAASDWLAGTRSGDSIAVNGVCLTVTGLQATGFAADVSRETLACTGLGSLAAGDRVNLEQALAAGDKLGGHLVSGHVDAVTTVLGRSADARSVRFQFGLPERLAQFVAVKGNICVDGTSLTVNEVEADRFGVNIVPHTLQQTIIGDYRAGTRVNLEVDLIARYVSRVLSQEV